MLAPYDVAVSFPRGEKIETARLFESMTASVDAWDLSQIGGETIELNRSLYELLVTRFGNEVGEGFNRRAGRRRVKVKGVKGV
jgi:hypothetical protein